MGHDVAISCSFGLQGKPIQMDGITVLPMGRDQYSNDILPAHAAYTGADIVITLLDAFALEACAVRQLRWVPWLPIDTEPVAPDVAQALTTAYQPIAFSRFGERKLYEAGFKPMYVPHGIDTAIFQPHDQAKGRHLLGVQEEAFLVGIVAANTGAPSRKAFDQQIRAFARFRQHHPDSLLYLHTDLTEIGKRRGEDIERLLALADIPPTAVIRVDPYRYATGLISQAEMAQRYNALDVLLNASRGGGFELPLIEAQACGTPVITTDFSAMAELVFGGWKVSYVDKCFYQNAYQVTPSVDGIVAALEAAYEMKRSGQIAPLRAKARAGALQYDADHVAQAYWKPTLAQIEARLRSAKQRLTPVMLPKERTA